MLEMSWITAISQLYSQVAGLFGNVIVKRINRRLFDLLTRFHYILNLPRISIVFDQPVQPQKAKLEEALTFGYKKLRGFC